MIKIKFKLIKKIKTKSKKKRIFFFENVGIINIIKKEEKKSNKS